MCSPILASILSGGESAGRHPGRAESESYPHLGIIPIPSANPSWTLTASDFLNAYQLAGKNEARAILMLGPGAGSLSPFALRDLANAVLTTSTDLALPHYDLPPNAGLVNSAILYPLTRALFACRARFPLAIDLGLSLRMAERLSGVAQRLVSRQSIRCAHLAGQRGRGSRIHHPRICCRSPRHCPMPTSPT